MSFFTNIFITSPIRNFLSILSSRVVSEKFSLFNVIFNLKVPMKVTFFNFIDQLRAEYFSKKVEILGLSLRDPCFK